MKLALLYLQSFLYIAAGAWHFMRPKMYMRIMPKWIPWHRPLVYATGIAEMVLGALLIPEASRSVAAWGLIVLLVLIFPANIQMMMIYRKKHHPYYWATVARLPLQLLLIYWAWCYT